MTPPSTSESKILGTVISLPVRDLEASADFYSNVFDIPDLQPDGGIITVELPGLSLFLIEETRFAWYSGKTGRGVGYPDTRVGVILSCAVASREEMDSTLETVARYGGSVPVPAAEEADTGLYLGYFFDPDGHHWELAFSGAAA